MDKIKKLEELLERAHNPLVAATDGFPLDDETAIAADELGDEIYRMTHREFIAFDKGKYKVVEKFEKCINKAPAWRTDVDNLASALWYALVIKSLGDGEYTKQSPLDLQSGYKTVKVGIYGEDVVIEGGAAWVRRGALGEFSGKYPFIDVISDTVHKILAKDYRGAVEQNFIGMDKRYYMDDYKVLQKCYESDEDEVSEALNESNDNGWISVKDRLPEYDKTVLVVNEDGYMHTAVRIKSSIARIDEWQIKFGVYFIDNDVWEEDEQGKITHWRHLPEPPKGE